MTKDVAKSIRARLLNLAKANGDNFNTLMLQYALQRFLYRLSVSEYASSFLLKGAWLFVMWNNSLHRPTKDIDFLGFGSNDKQVLLTMFKQIAGSSDIAPDGIRFLSDGFKASDIDKDGHYHGVRIMGTAMLGTAKLPMQFDIGFGDAVTPGPLEAVLPSILGMPAPTLRVYPVYTVIAEKFHAMVVLGSLNSRLKDFYDLYTIAMTQSLDGSLLAQAIVATFMQRNTALTKEGVLVFEDDFLNDVTKKQQWLAFVNKNRIDNKLTFAELMYQLRDFLSPIYALIVADKTPHLFWDAEQWRWTNTNV